MSLPTIGVVICTRGDRLSMLREAVVSAIDQDFEGDVEVVVVYDLDVSPPLPIEIPSRPGRRVRWVLNEKRHGLARARNRGIAATDAAWLAFLDDDDLWKPGKLTAQWRVVEQAPYIDLVATGIEISHGGHTRRRPAPAAWFSHADLVRDRIAELHPSTFLLRRSTLEEVGCLDVELPGAYAEDYDLLLRISSRGAVGSVIEPLVTVRWSGNSYFFGQWHVISLALTYLLVKHGESFARSDPGRARIRGQVAFAEAAMGHRSRANALGMMTLREHPGEVRGLLALLVANTPVSPDLVQEILHRTGRGI